MTMQCVRADTGWSARVERLAGGAASPARRCRWHSGSAPMGTPARTRARAGGRASGNALSTRRSCGSPGSNDWGGGGGVGFCHSSRRPRWWNHSSWRNRDATRRRARAVRQAACRRTDRPFVRVGAVLVECVLVAGDQARLALGSRLFSCRAPTDQLERDRPEPSVVVHEIGPQRRDRAGRRRRTSPPFAQEVDDAFRGIRVEAAMVVALPGVSFDRRAAGNSALHRAASGSVPTTVPGALTPSAGNTTCHPCPSTEAGQSTKSG